MRGHRIKEFYFRSKVGSAWPGKVRIVLDNQEVVLLPSSARKKLKDYFVPERCLYCVDKLNRNADISVGDNYIKENADEEGISSVIIRTDVGFEAWSDCASLFEWSQDEKMALLDSQQCRKKKENYEFGCLKGVYPRAEVSREIRKKYHWVGRSFSYKWPASSEIVPRKFRLGISGRRRWLSLFICWSLSNSRSTLVPIFLL